MRVAHLPGSIKKFHRTPWRFQRTFHTPLRDLESFSTAILRSLDPIHHGGAVTIDAIVMHAKNLKSLLALRRLPQDLRRETTVFADTADEAQPLLAAALGDWVDFLFVPDPRPFVLYADHDEHATFFAHTKSNLAKVTSSLETQGFKAVENHIGNFSSR